MEYKMCGRRKMGEKIGRYLLVRRDVKFKWERRRRGISLLYDEVGG